ncbi:olfactory receptor 6X1-like [Podarcis raffonei]|uniref:olfactory receptor 6X1-like n=1 Tax=Podarcis raffonei TaxID=65483 RepID=UPI0023292767|nr:olfactory receptor 6X1-like [Podarcis raffonei]
MEEGNVTSITEFILLGFPELHDMRMAFVGIVLLMYLLSISGNCLIITVVFIEPKLHTPMYFFLSNFSLAELCSSTTVIPKMLTNMVLDQNTICYMCCMTQTFMVFSMGAIQFINLTVMSFDRYTAICQPFKYNIKMTNTLSFHLSLMAWVVGFTVIFFQLIVVWTSYPFCGNVIDHFFCDIGPVLKLACADTTVWELASLFYSVVIMCGSFFFSVGSYACILKTIVQIPSVTGRSKAFSTCSSHLTIVGIFYGAAFFMYLRPSTQGDTRINKVIFMVICVVLPTLSPFIFTIRNNDFKTAAKKAMGRICQLPSSVVMRLLKQCSLQSTFSKFFNEHNQKTLECH